MSIASTHRAPGLTDIKNKVTRQATSSTAIAQQFDERRQAYQQRQAELSTLSAQYAAGEEARRRLHVGQELDGENNADALTQLEASQVRLAQTIKQKQHGLEIEPQILAEIESRLTAARVDEANAERRQLADHYWAADKKITALEAELIQLHQQREAAYQAERELRVGGLLTTANGGHYAPSYIQVDDH